MRATPQFTLVRTIDERQRAMKCKAFGVWESAAYLTYVSIYQMRVTPQFALVRTTDERQRAMKCKAFEVLESAAYLTYVSISQMRVTPQFALFVVRHTIRLISTPP